MLLRAGYLAVALKLQESADLSANDVRTRLSDAINDAHRGTGNWGYYIDHFGDAESGDVIYSCNGDTRKAPYEISDTGGASKCVVDTTNAVDVMPRTVYEEEQDEADHLAQMEESLKSEKLYTALPLYERFISKTERANLTADDFAGKGKSFPISKPEDIMAAVHSMGRAGSGNLGPSGIKARIIAIAKRKGWEKYLPKGWQTTEGKEARSPDQSAGGLRLVESAQFPCDVTLREAFGESKKIKLISPGKGATAWYTVEALKQSVVDNIFHAGLPMRIDHPTKSEETQRPEGSVKDWGAVLGADAQWLESYVHPKSGKDLGAGLYSDVKPFSDHAQTIEEKGPYAGVSIAAYGEPLIENGKKVMRDGVPVIGRFTSADGVDMVTRAGAGGLFLTEAAKPANPQHEGGADDMDAAELTKLKESLALREANEKKMLERAIRGDARDFAVRALKGVTLHEAGKDLVIESVMGREIPQKDGALDEAKFKESLDAEAKRVGAAIAAAVGSGQVRGMGAAPVVAIDAKEAERNDAERKRLREATVRSFIDLGMPQAAAEKAADGKAAA